MLQQQKVPRSGAKDIFSYIHFKMTRAADRDNKGDVLSQRDKGTSPFGYNNNNNNNNNNKDNNNKVLAALSASSPLSTLAGVVHTNPQGWAPTNATHHRTSLLHLCIRPQAADAP